MSGPSECAIVAHRRGFLIRISNKTEFLPQLLRSSKTTRLKASSHERSRDRLIVRRVLECLLQCTSGGFRIPVFQVTLTERVSCSGCDGATWTSMEPDWL